MNKAKEYELIFSWFFSPNPWVEQMDVVEFPDIDVWFSDCKNIVHVDNCTESMSALGDLNASNTHQTTDNCLLHFVNHKNNSVQSQHPRKYAVDDAIKCHRLLWKLIRISLTFLLRHTIQDSRCEVFGHHRLSWCCCQTERRTRPELTPSDQWRPPEDSNSHPKVLLQNQFRA